jgi:hypothetical protein
LGSTTLAASREKVDDIPIDNHFLSLALSAGVPAALLLILILVRATVFCFRGWRRSEPGTHEENLWRIMLSLMAAFILNNCFGTTFTIYSIAPLGWLLIGWISANYVKPSKAAERPAVIDRNAKWQNVKGVSYQTS